MNKEKEKTTGIVFGVFDGLHEGHRHFLSEAAKAVDHLVTVLTLPETTILLKGHAPRQTYDERKDAIRAFDPDIEVIPGDAKPGTWSVFRERTSCIAILGYDQQGIAIELEKMNIPFVFAQPYRPDIYKSSLLGKN